MSPGLKEKFNDDLKQAMRDRNQVKMGTIRMLLSALHYAEMAKQKEFDDSEVLGILAREIKQRHESIDAFKKGARQDLVDKEEAELAILMQYMPAQLSRDEIVAEVNIAIKEAGASGPGDKGKVMQKLMPKLKGKADGKLINDIVTEILSK
jgi:uncharacterized protein